MLEALDVVVPVYNEEVSVVRELVAALRMALKEIGRLTIIVVDDGSMSRYGMDSLSADPTIVFIRHSVNQGYGSALKTGILSGSAAWIAIIDADGTYSPSDLPELVKLTGNADMVVGARTGSVRKIPFSRRVPKYLLNKMASYLSGIHICDLNSGLRIFRRSLCNELWDFLPRRFSFTSTMTMGSYLLGRRVTEKAVNYYQRRGVSSVRPLRDTVAFANIILRLGMLFHPMKLFAPAAFLLFALGFSKGVLRDFLTEGKVGNMSVVVMLSAIQVLLMGYVAEMIVSLRTLLCRNMPGRVNTCVDPPEAARSDTDSRFLA